LWYRPGIGTLNRQMAKHGGSHEPLRQFVTAFDAALARAAGSESALFLCGKPIIAQLIAADGWLPDEFAHPRELDYASYLLYADPAQRYVVVSFAWGERAQTPIHDHTVWGMIGVMRGCEASRRYAIAGDGAFVAGADERLERGMVETVSPTVGDIHQVWNGSEVRSVSIHVYGADLVKRPHHAYDPDSGRGRTIYSQPFVNAAPFMV
jgi:3-mercaptopropionate dioxygenase